MTRKHNGKSSYNYIYLSLSLLMMLLIFLFSQQPGETSYQISGAVTEAAGTITGISEAASARRGFSLEYFVRKFAHVFLYAGLGATVYLEVKQRILWSSGRVRPFISLIVGNVICACYACLDEFHQYFIPGRNGLLSDVRFDAAGFIPASIAVMLLCRVIGHRPYASETGA